MSTSALVVTAGAANANAYVSIEVADQYHEDRPKASEVWANAVHPMKAQGILRATKLLDRLVPWTGDVVTETQALLWPRVGMCYRNGYSIPSDIIPLDLQHATAEYARHLLDASAIYASQSGKSQLEELALSAQRHGLNSVSSGNVSITREGAGVDRPEKIVPDEVYDLMPPGWLAHSRMVLELLRG